MDPYELKKLIDETIIAYIEGKIGIGEAAEKLIPYANTENFIALDKAGMGNTSSILEQLTDSDYYLSQDDFNHHKPGNLLSVIDKYYEEIKK